MQIVKCLEFSNMLGRKMSVNVVQKYGVCSSSVSCSNFEMKRLSLLLTWKLMILKAFTTYHCTWNGWSNCY